MEKELSRKLRKRRKVNVDLEISKIEKERLPWQSSYSIGYVSFSLYRDDAVLHIKVVTKKKYRESQEEGWFNSYQYFLYRRAMFGLEVYGKDELEWMNRGKKRRVTHVHERAAETIQKFMQMVMIQVTNRFFVIMFPIARVTKQLLVHHSEPVGKSDVADRNESEPDYICTLNPQEFKISRRTIAGLLVLNHVLPENFFDLGVKDDPRLKKLQQPISEPIDTL